MIRLLAAFLILTTSFRGSATAQEEAPPSAPPRVDLKVVSWFRISDPIASFQYQIYDLRKGDYTPAVDHWVSMMQTKYAAYHVSVSDVDLAREKGPNETRKVGAVVYRELLAAAAAEGVFLSPQGSPRRIVARAPLTVSLQPIPGLPGPLPGISPVPMMFNQNPLPMGFPVPMPYPRPHP